MSIVKKAKPSNKAPKEFYLFVKFTGIINYS